MDGQDTELESGPKAEATEADWRLESFPSRYEPLQSWISSLDLLNRQPLLCGPRDPNRDFTERAKGSLEARTGEIAVSLGVGVTGALGLLLFGPGVYVSAGINGGLTSNLTPFLQIQGAVGGGVGSYVGVGVQGGASYSKAPIDPGITFAAGTQIETNVGWGPSWGVSYQTSDGSNGGQTGNIPKLPAKYGAGVGAHLSAGPSGTLTLGIPLVTPENMPWAP